MLHTTCPEPRTLQGLCLQAARLGWLPQRCNHHCIHRAYILGRAYRAGWLAVSYEFQSVVCCLLAQAGSSDGSLINITLHFRKDLLGSDAVMVNDPLMQAIQLTDPISGWGFNPDIQLLAKLGVSPDLWIDDLVCTNRPNGFSHRHLAVFSPTARYARAVK